MSPRTLRPVWALACVLALAACASPAPESARNYLPDDPTSTSGLWILHRGSVANESIEAPDGEPIVLEIVDGTLTGSSACSVYSATIGRGSGTDPIGIGNMTGTDVGCDPAAMRLENDYLRGLGELADLRREGDDLTGVGVEVDLDFAPIVPGQASEWVGRPWLLHGLDYHHSVLGRFPGSEATITFAKDGSFSGNTGCRDFAGDWAESDGQVTVEDLTLTRDGCADADLQTQDTRLRWILEEGFTAISDDGVLILKDRDMGATFRPMPS